MKKERELAETREKDLKKKIDQGLKTVEELKEEIAKLQKTLSSKDGEIRGMQEQVKEAEETVKRERTKAENRVN